MYKRKKHKILDLKKRAFRGKQFPRHHHNKNTEYTLIEADFLNTVGFIFKCVPQEVYLNGELPKKSIQSKLYKKRYNHILKRTDWVYTYHCLEVYSAKKLIYSTLLKNIFNPANQEENNIFFLTLNEAENFFKVDLSTLKKKFTITSRFLPLPNPEYYQKWLNQSKWYNKKCIKRRKSLLKNRLKDVLKIKNTDEIDDDRLSCCRKDIFESSDWVY